MAELDLTNIADGSISTPASGVTALFVNTNAPAKRLATKDDAGTLVQFVGLATSDTGAQRLQNKDIDVSNCSLVDPTDTTKEIDFTCSGNTTGIVLTLASAQSTSQTLNVPNITASSIIITDTLTQSITGVKTMTNMTTAAGTTTIPSMTLTSGTNMTTPTAGVVEFDGTAMYTTNDTTNGRRYNDNWHYFRLTANGSAISTIADFFGTNDGIPTVLNGVYEIEWHCYFVVATGGTSTWTIVNTQTVTNMVANWIATPIAGFATQGTMTGAGVITQTNASVALPVTGSLSAANHYHVIKATIEAGTAGNVRLRQTMSAGTSTPQRDSYFKVRRIPSANVGTYVA
jgi:hypothetical protein